MAEVKKQNITLSLSVQTIKKAKILAAKRSTSISGLLAAQVEALVGEDDAYERARATALALMHPGFDLAGPKVSRDELHER